MKLAILGASGRTGRLVVHKALEAGHDVRALVRSATKLGITHPRLETRTGDATDAPTVAGLVEGCDAVLSALGPVEGRNDVCSVATGHVIAAGARRYVAISGAGIDVPGDRKDLVGRIASFATRKLAPAVFQDKVREHELLEKSTLAWTLVRPPRLVDRPAAGEARMNLERCPGASIAREALASFALRCVGDDALIRRAPFVAG